MRRRSILSARRWFAPARPAEGARVLADFERVRESGAAVTYSQTYLEQGRYAEAIASTGLEPDLVDAATPAVRFSDQTQSWGGAARPSAP